MDFIFLGKLGLSFLVGCIWVILSTLAAGKYGSKVGGLVGGLPSTVVVALLFIGLTQSPLEAASATTAIPLAQGINGLFLVAYLYFVRKGLWSGLLGGLAVWAVLAGLLLALGLKNFWISLGGWLVLASGCILAVEKAMGIHSQKGARINPTRSQVLFRGLFGGTVIVLAVVMGKLGGPVFGGVFSAFPAMFLSTLVITYHDKGAEFSQAVGKSLVLSGEVNVVLYAVLVRVFYREWGLALGTAAALIICLVSGFLLYLFMKKRLG